MAAKPVIAIIGQTANHKPEYVSTDWIERDNFETMELARNYATFKSRMFPATPYRIRKLRGRFTVEFVPEWNLR